MKQKGVEYILLVLSLCDKPLASVVFDIGSTMEDAEGVNERTIGFALSPPSVLDLETREVCV